MSNIHLPETLGSSAFGVNYAGKQVPAIVGLSSLSIKGQAKQPGHGRLTRALAITAFFAAFGNSFTHGFHTGVLNSPAKHIRTFLNISYLDHFGETTPELVELLWSVTVSIYLVGGCIGAFAAGSLADRFGRKRAIMMMALPGLIGEVLFGFCQRANSFEMLILGRLIIGFSCGAGSGLVPMYLTEIAPVNIRGAMGVLHQLALTCGILVSQLLGLRQILGDEDFWPILLAMSAIPFICCCSVLPFYPDSPRWLLTRKGTVKEGMNDHETKPTLDEVNIQHARKALQKFRGEQDVEHDLADMMADVRAQRHEPAWDLRKLFTSRPHRIPFMLVCVLAVVQQLSGINMVFYYSDGVFSRANIAESDTQYANLGMGSVNVIVSLISVVLVEKAGRRPLLIGGMLGMIVSLIILTVALNLQDQYSWLSYLSIFCLIVFVVTFAVGLGPIPQFIGAELFKQGPRPAAMSFAGMLNWVANFIVGISFPFIQLSTGPYCMLFFIVFISTFGAAIWKYLPETKNKTFDQIASEMGIKTSSENTRDEERTALQTISSTGKDTTAL